MERLQNETIETFESRLWAEHSSQQSAAARAATSVAFYVEDGVITGGAVVSSYNPLSEPWVFWCDLPKDFEVKRGKMGYGFKDGNMYEVVDCTGLDGSHEYADVVCPYCSVSNCHSCCSFDSRPDPAHDPDHPYMRCRNCGKDFDV